MEFIAHEMAKFIHVIKWSKRMHTCSTNTWNEYSLFLDNLDLYVIENDNDFSYTFTLVPIHTHTHTHTLPYTDIQYS